MNPNIFSKLGCPNISVTKLCASPFHHQSCVVLQTIWLPCAEILESKYSYEWANLEKLNVIIDVAVKKTLTIILNVFIFLAVTLILHLLLPIPSFFFYKKYTWVLDTKPCSWCYISSLSSLPCRHPAVISISPIHWVHTVHLPCDYNWPSACLLSCITQLLLAPAIYVHHNTNNYSYTALLCVICLKMKIVIDLWISNEFWVSAPCSNL